MFGQSLLSGAFGTALVPGDHFMPHRYTGASSNPVVVGGKYGGSAAFNGSDNYWVTNPGLGESGDRTRALWIYINTMPAASSGDAVYYLGDSSSNGYYENFAVRETAGATTYKFRYNERYDSAAGGSNEEIYSITTLTTGVWYHVALVFDGSSRKLYINGSLDNSATFTNTVNNTSYPFYLATFRNVCCYLDGVLDQFRLYNTALNATQIGYLYNASNTESTTLDFPSGTGCKAAYTFNNNGNTILSQDDLDTVDFPSGAGCVGLYRLQNSGVDTAGNNNGTLVNSPGLQDPLGPFGDCMDFTPASSQYINLGTGVYNGYTAMTVSAWVWYDAASNYPYTFWAGDGGTDGAGIGLALNHSTWKMYSWNGGTTQTSTAVFNAYQWYHVAVTYGGTTCKLYINGDLDSTHTVTQMNLDTSSNPTSIGYYSDSGNPGYYFDGKMAQMRIYNTALTAAQIETLAKGEPKYNGTVWPNGIDVKFNRSLNFKPDLIFAKSRTYGYPPMVADSVRGFGSDKMLFSDFTGEQGSTDNNYANAQAYGYLSNVNDNGFYGASGSTNGSYIGGNGAGDYISWNWKAGADTYAGLFNGTSTKITTDYTTNDSEFSVSVWAYPRVDPGSVYLYHANKGYYTNSSNTNYWSLQNYAVNTPSFQVRLNSTAVYATSSVSMVAGKWYHLVGTCDSSGNLKIYVNGTETGSASGAPARSMGQAIIFGQYMDGSWASGYYKGQMNQIRYFNQAISASEVTSLYNEGLSDNNTLDFPTGAGCTSAWPLNGSPDPLSGSSMGSTPVDLKFVKPGYTGKNNDGTIESQVSVNQDAGFSIVKWSGYNAAGTTVGHGLGKQPQLIITKNLTTAASWPVFYGSAITTSATTFTIPASTNYWLGLNDTWAYTAYTLDQQFGGQTNGSSNDQMISYCWVSVPKYSKIGNYTGGSSGKQVNVGFQPSWLLIKRTDSTGGWRLQDSKRVGSSVDSKNVLELNGPWAEQANYVDLPFTATGFTLNTTNGDYNSSGGEYIYMAFA